jgi:FkbM family methyltransferase
MVRSIFLNNKYKEIHKRLRRYFLKPDILILDHHKFKIPVNSAEVSSFELNEIWMIDFLKNYINISEGVFLDIGVNLGQTLLKLSTTKKMEYVGFEPNPHCVSYVNRLIDLNKLKNCKIIPVGLTDWNGVINLQSFGGNTDSAATIMKNYRPNPIIKEWIVPLFSLDYLENDLALKNISIIKIDVEGSELEVLKGSIKILKKHLPLIVAEILPVYKKNSIRHQRQVELEKLLNELGYLMFRIYKNEKKVIKLEQINEIGVHADLDLCEYLFLPDNHHDSILINI